MLACNWRPSAPESIGLCLSQTRPSSDRWAGLRRRSSRPAAQRPVLSQRPHQHLESGVRRTRIESRPAAARAGRSATNRARPRRMGAGETDRSKEKLRGAGCWRSTQLKLRCQSGPRALAETIAGLASSDCQCSLIVHSTLYRPRCSWRLGRSDRLLRTCASDAAVNTQVSPSRTGRLWACAWPCPWPPLLPSPSWLSAWLQTGRRPAWPLPCAAAQPCTGSQQREPLSGLESRRRHAAQSLQTHLRKASEPSSALVCLG